MRRNCRSLWRNASEERLRAEVSRAMYWIRPWFRLTVMWTSTGTTDPPRVSHSA